MGLGLGGFLCYGFRGLGKSRNHPSEKHSAMLALGVQGSEFICVRGKELQACFRFWL